MSIAAGSSDTMGARTSSVRTSVLKGKGPAQPDNENDVEDKDDEEDDEDEEDYRQYDEIGMSQLYGALFGTQYDYQVPQTTLTHICYKFRDSKY